MELTAARSARASLIREHGMQVGVGLKPGTPHEAVAPYVDLVDMVRPNPRPNPHPNPRPTPTLAVPQPSPGARDDRRARLRRPG